MVDPRVQAHLELDVRAVSLIDRLRVYVTGPGSLLWTLTAFCLAVAWAMSGQAVIVDYLRFPFESTATVRGTVLDADDTNVEINERTVSWVTYTYAVEDRTIHGMSFGSEYYPASGSTVRVEYLVDTPGWSRIMGRTRAGMNSPISAVFAVVALLFAIAAVFRSFKAASWIRLLKFGRPGYATLRHKKPTNITVNDERVYELEFEYACENGDLKTFTVKRSDYDDITDDPRELIIHDGGDNVLFFDELPVPFAPGRQDNWRYVGSGTLVGSVIKRALAPAIVLGLGVLFG